MFKDDVDFVRDAVNKYGLRLPFVDLGGLRARDVTLADYSITIKTHDQWARYLHLEKDPFYEVAGDYAIINPQYGDGYIQDLPAQYPEAFGTIVCLSVLEHVENPFDVFDAFPKMLKPDGLLMLSTVFSFPYHPSPDDRYRFSPSGLEVLAKHAGMKILECGWRLDINADAGVKEIHTGVSQEIKSVAIVCQKSVS